MPPGKGERSTDCTEPMNPPRCKSLVALGTPSDSRRLNGIPSAKVGNFLLLQSGEMVLYSGSKLVQTALVWSGDGICTEEQWNSS